MARRILGSKQHEAAVCLHRLLGLRDEEFSIVVKETVESLEHIARGQVELI
ncbi:hypothetical protein DPMN_054928 [Dreissena polymorpha]|uniref:Uncharacterized protein n=1 Tax=Dreissena polymorpha TaxID=45954 RepID=A0A9D4HS25_DREPO|nr:hypothetical protein DPMN_054928 [Dreissena polymorpha]